MKKIIIAAVFAVGFISCQSDYLDRDQESNFSDDKMAELQATPELALKLYSAIEGGNYNNLVAFQSGGTDNHRDFGLKGFDIGLDLMSGDMAEVMSTNMWSPYATYTGRLENGAISYSLWYFNTRVTSAMNNVIIGAEGSNDRDFVEISARARAVRAFANFNLIRLFANGDDGIPFADKDVFFNSRQSTQSVLEFIEADLMYAYNNLNGYARDSKNYVNQNVVAGFLSRFYLYMKDYSRAEQYSDLAIVNSSAIDFDIVNDGFDVLSNPDWMWGFDIDGSTSTIFASYFSWMDNVNSDGYGGIFSGMFGIDADLFSKISPTDKRKKWFTQVNVYNPYDLRNLTNMKFVDRTGSFQGDYSYMRETEMFFNKAEAKYHLGDETSALEILKSIVVTRDSTYSFNGTGANLLEEIKLQKRIEFWGEGLAFYDALRWERDVIRNYNGSNHLNASFFNVIHPSNLFRFQFPVEEVRANPDLGRQNPAN